MKILITGGDGRFCNELKKFFYGKNIFYLSKTKFNILKYQFILKKLRDLKIDTLIHTAALSRPMAIHNSKIEKVLIQI